MTIKELSKLSDDELRVKCAEALGYTREPYMVDFGGPETFAWVHPSGSHICDGVPNYPADLNAMHEVIKPVGSHNIPAGDFNIAEFVYALADVLELDHESLTGEAETWCYWAFLSATARQLCIAFIATKTA